jgi:dTDP-4-amino-4,6-dideoxygalactose transaminase
MINIFKPYVSSIAKFKLAEVLSSGTLTQGHVVDEFENLLETEMSLPSRPITTNSCTSAIDLAYELIGIGPGDNVITTAQTCFATNGSLLHRGANIYWADIDNDGLVSVDSVSEIFKIQPDIKAIVAVDWAGRLPDYDALKSFGVPVVEDAAHRWDRNLSGRSRGDYVCYSFQAIKFLTTGDGGLLVTPDDQVTRGRSLRWFGLDRDNKQDFRSAQDIPEAGFKYHMNNLNASIGKANLVDINYRVALHNANASKIMESVSSLKFINSSYTDTATFWMLPLLVADGKRDSLIEKLKERGIEANMVHSRNDKYSCMNNTFSIVPLHGLDDFSSSQVNIPCGWWLTKEEVKKIIDALSDIDMEFEVE